jgi:hypothetical protein
MAQDESENLSDWRTTLWTAAVFKRTSACVNRPSARITEFYFLDIHPHYQWNYKYRRAKHEKQKIKIVKYSPRSYRVNNQKKLSQKYGNTMETIAALDRHFY